MSTDTLTEMQTTLETLAIEPVPAFKELLAEFTALEHERREHEDRLKVIGERLGKITEPLLDHFADSGIQNANVNGLTVYVRIDRFVSKRGDATTDQVCAALRECGLSYMVNDGYNAQSLKSKVREYQESGVEVPTQLAGLLNIGEVARLATRK